MLKELQKTIAARGKTYAPGENRFINLEMHAAIRFAILDELERQGIETDAAEQEMIGHIADKTARGVCGALQGVVHEDNAVDTLGYSVILAAYRKGVTPEELVDDALRKMERKRK